MKRTPIHVQTILAFALSASAVGSGITSAGIVTYTSQVRTVTASGGVSGGSIFSSAPDFLAWDGTVSGSFPNPDGQPDSTGAASQRSFLNPDGIQMTGSCSGSDSYGFGGAGAGLGRSVLDVAFNFAGADDAYRTTGSLRSFSSRASSLLVRFSRVSPSPAVLFETTTFGVRSWDLAGTITAGSYRLQVDLLEGLAGSGTGFASSTYDVKVLIPAPASGVVLAVLPLAIARRRR